MLGQRESAEDTSGPEETATVQNRTWLDVRKLPGGSLTTCSRHGGPAGKWHTVAWRDAGVWTETQERRIPDSVKAGASLEGGDPRAQGHRRLAERRRAHLHGERAAWPRAAPTARGSASGLASLPSSNASLKKG